MSVVYSLTSPPPTRADRLNATPVDVVPVHLWYLHCKLVADFVFALVLFVLTAPLMLLAMLLVKITSRGPAIYTQVRLGRNGKPFLIYKIRTMFHQCEKHSGAQWSRPGDSRITPLGRWLRRTHIDELPQLWNVLMGSMSLVGPRPERPEFAPQLEQAIPLYRRRLMVRPGVTGLAQVQLPPDTDLDSVRSKLAFDLHYVRQCGPLLDLRILGATFFKMLSLPFAAIRSIFVFPTRATIEEGYQQLVEATVPYDTASQPANHEAASPNGQALNGQAPNGQATVRSR